MSSFNVISSNIDQRLREGFTQFQKDANFVDMVIAADGCFKKVHRSIIALSSPYLAELMNAMPSNNQVLYLYGVKHQMFNYLVQYIYSGHVEVPFEAMNEFIQIVQQLQIKGLENIQNVTNDETQFLNTQQGQLANHVTNSSLMDIDALNCDNNVQHATYENKHIIDFEEVIDQTQPQPLVLPDTSCDLSNTTDILNSITDYNYGQPSTSEQQTTCNLVMPQINLTAEGSFSLEKIIMDQKPPGNGSRKRIAKIKTGNNDTVLDNMLDKVRDHKYCLANKGGQVHLILDGYTFYAHNTFVHKNKRRWRCTSYRRKGCRATLDTEENDITMCRTPILQHNHKRPTEKERKYATLYDTFEDATSVIRQEQEQVSEAGSGSDTEFII